MHPDRWRRVEDLVHAALEQAPNDRASFLTEACARSISGRMSPAISATVGAAEWLLSCWHRSRRLN